MARRVALFVYPENCNSRLEQYSSVADKVAEQLLKDMRKTHITRSALKTLTKVKSESELRGINLNDLHKGFLPDRTDHIDLAVVTCPQALKSVLQFLQKIISQAKPQDSNGLSRVALILAVDPDTQSTDENPKLQHVAAHDIARLDLGVDKAKEAFAKRHAVYVNDALGTETALVAEFIKGYPQVESDWRAKLAAQLSSR